MKMDPCLELKTDARQQAVAKSCTAGSSIREASSSTTKPSEMQEQTVQHVYSFPGFGLLDRQIEKSQSQAKGLLNCKFWAAPESLGSDSLNGG